MPVAAASATAEPDTPDIRKLATTPTLASPPCMWPTTTAATRTRRWVTPQTFISSPAKMNSGTDTRTKPSRPTVICCAKSANDVGVSVSCDSAI